MEQMMASPLMDSVMSNPAFLQSVLQSDPRFERMVQEHPEIRQALEDPSFLREISGAMRNPRLVFLINLAPGNAAKPR